MLLRLGKGVAVAEVLHLKRTLTLGQLVVMGVIFVQPTAPMPPYGAIHVVGDGHVVTTVLIAMFAMLCTAVSYGRMAQAYPAAGSAYTYVGREVHPVAGFLTGWCMLLDYVVNPLICTIWCASAARDLVPALPGALWTVFFAALFTGLNLRGIRATARTNQLLTAVMGVVIGWVLAASLHYLAGQPQIDWIRPFYDAQRFSLGKISSGASVAVLTYIGFDAISTLSEEVHNPRRNILRATVYTCLIIGLLSAVEVYAAQLVWPPEEPFPNNDTAYVHVAGRAGGVLLFQVVALTILVATVGSGSGAQLAGARLLYGMGRDGTLPRTVFGTLHPVTRIPANNVVLIGLVCLLGGFLISYQFGVELLNFGALLGFMGVNLSALLRYWIRAEKKRLSHFLPPAIGLLVCTYLWLSLSKTAQLAGWIWLLLGLIAGAYQTAGFRRPMPRFETGEASES
ncbi:MAG: APC family permease [Bryobacteraceae bacterium]|nr:APC family permease [Bryobacteraceae bacterium]MDW8378465.1 APC family permease [Bryobacterales bacterium]